MKLTCVKAAPLLPPNAATMMARLLPEPCSLLFVASTMAAAINLPQTQQGLHFTNAVRVWDEALPLGNGILGALVWGDGQPLKISLDRTDLWDLTPVPEFQSDDYDYATMRQWHEQGKHADLVRVYEAPYNRPAPTKIPAGRIEVLPAVPDSWRDAAFTTLRAQGAFLVSAERREWFRTSATPLPAATPVQLRVSGDFGRAGKPAISVRLVPE